MCDLDIGPQVTLSGQWPPLSTPLAVHAIDWHDRRVNVQLGCPAEVVREVPYEWWLEIAAPVHRRVKIHSPISKDAALQSTEIDDPPKLCAMDVEALVESIEQLCGDGIPRPQSLLYALRRLLLELGPERTEILLGKSRNRQCLRMINIPAGFPPSSSSAVGDVMEPNYRTIGLSQSVDITPSYDSLPSRSQSSMRGLPLFTDGVMQLQPGNPKLRGRHASEHDLQPPTRDRYHASSTHQHHSGVEGSVIQLSALASHAPIHGRFVPSVPESPCISQEDRSGLYNFWCREAHARNYATFDFDVLLKVSSMIRKTEWVTHWPSALSSSLHCATQSQKERHAALSACISVSEQKRNYGTTASRMLVMFAKHEVDVVEKQLQSNRPHGLKRQNSSHANRRANALELVSEGMSKDVRPLQKKSKNYYSLVEKAGPGFLLLLDTKHGSCFERLSEDSLLLFLSYWQKMRADVYRVAVSLNDVARDILIDGLCSYGWPENELLRTESSLIKLLRSRLQSRHADYMHHNDTSSGEGCMTTRNVGQFRGHSSYLHANSRLPSDSSKGVISRLDYSNPFMLSMESSRTHFSAYIS